MLRSTPAQFSVPRGAAGDTSPALRYPHDAMLTLLDQAPRATTELFDARAIAAELAALADSHTGDERELRLAVTRRLRAALVEGRRVAEQLLLKDRHGRRCAERLCLMLDEIIQVLFDFALHHLYPSQNPSEAERMAIVATGGYGRGVLAPGSDIDLLFLLPYKQTAWGESVAEAILYCLWDMGLKVGHATRTVNECIRQAKADMTIRTALLEARFLLGERKLFDELVTRFDKEIVQGTGADFVAAKLAEREERHRRAGQSRYLVEPNVKDGKGGLRDLHTLYWIAKYVYRVHEREELIELGVYDPREYRRFRRCGDFLWAVRCHMHFLAGRAEERLSFDIQREIAVRLGYTEHPGTARRRALHEALLPDRQGRRRPHRHPVRQARGQPGQGDAGAQPRDGQVPAAGAALAQRERRFRRRLQPHQRGRRRGVQARSGQPDPHLPPGAEIQSGASPRRHARRHPLAQADRRQAARERGGEPPVPRDPHLEERRRDRAAQDERGRTCSASSCPPSAASSR